MPFRIYLNEKGVNSLEPPVAQRADLLRVGSRMLPMYNDKGQKYLEVEEDILTAGACPVPQELVGRVTYRDKIYAGFRPDGLYVHDQRKGFWKSRVVAWSRIRIKTQVSMNVIYGEDDEYESVAREVCQEIHGSASDLSELQFHLQMVLSGFGTTGRPHIWDFMRGADDVKFVAKFTAMDQATLA